MQRLIGLGRIDPDLRPLYFIKVNADCEMKLTAEMVDHLPHGLPFVIELNELLRGIY